MCFSNQKIRSERLLRRLQCNTPIQFEGEAAFPWAAGGSPQWEPTSPGAWWPLHRATPGLAGQAAFSWAFQCGRYGQENLF